MATLKIKKGDTVRVIAGAVKFFKILKSVGSACRSSIYIKDGSNVRLPAGSASRSRQEPFSFCGFCPFLSAMARVIQHFV